MKDREPTLPWHHEARRLWDSGVYDHGEIGRRVGRSRSVVQLFLNPYTHAKVREYNSRWHRERRARSAAYREREHAAKRRWRAKVRAQRMLVDPEFAERVRRRAKQADWRRRRELLDGVVAAE